ncbi:hypothetical protein ElyMa_000782300 [Elysia marginata]|uniref:Uncharacterized protein n=1 Tax=Elysia marginata TaxID=1093978 RepID=A0AAV4GUP2_9GAST|nr:hypothetical protein ElyMa_000782300 [Elysia marginata]
MLHHPLFFGGKGEAVEDNESPRLPFLPPIVSMATQAYPTRSHSHLQHLYHQHQQQQQQKQQQRQDQHHHQHQRHHRSHQHHETHSSLPRPARDSALTLRLGPVARARTFAAESAAYDPNYLPRLGAKEIPVDDVSFVRESLNHLPNLPAFTFLRHSLLAGRGTYVHIVASILLHQKQLRSRYRLDHNGRPIYDHDEEAQSTDDVSFALQRMRKHKQPDYEFPGFCSGCRRAGFCYGCEKNPRPHIHEDVPAMMGGGFRFYRRDRPRDPHPWKHPGNWNLPESEAELMNIIKEHGGLHAYEQAVARARHDMLRMMEAQEVPPYVDTPSSSVKYQRLKNLGTYPPQVTIVSTEDFGDDRGLSEYDKEDDDEEEEDFDKMTMKTYEGEDEEERKEAPEEDGTLLEMEDKEDDLLIEEEEDGGEIRQDIARTDGKLRERKVGMTSPQDTDSAHSRPMRIDTGIDTDYTSDADDRKSSRGRRPKVSIMEPREQELSRKRIVSTQSKSSKTRSDSGSRSRSSPPKARTTSRVEYLDFQREQQKEEEARARREPPKFFTVQKRTRRITVARDPFSTDRQLNVPKGGTFQIKKSEKKTTEFAEFGKGDRGWTAPKKFEVKAREKKTTQFWTPPPAKSSDDDSRRKRRKRNESESPGRR